MARGQVLGLDGIMLTLVGAYIFKNILVNDTLYMLVGSYGNK